MAVTAPSVDTRVWQDHAACAGKPDVFYPDPSPPFMPWAYDPARQICLVCPVRSDCLAYVRTHPQVGGMWAGMTEEERDVDRRRWRQRHRDGSTLTAVGDEPPPIQPTLLSST